MDQRNLSPILDRDWDLVIVGGGVTGAGIFERAARLGWQTLLVEARDFAWGTSSKSGKLIHGGLRYLAQGQVRTTWHSVRERDRLTERYKGLVEPLDFVIPVPKAKPGMRRKLGLGLAAYDLMSGRWQHRFLPEASLNLLAPALSPVRTGGGFTYADALTDDSRLVWRLIAAGEAAGGAALNYLAALKPDLDGQGQVRGLGLKDLVTGRTTTVRARAVVNAAGAWADGLRLALGAEAIIRRQRGSHLIFPHWRFPLAQAVTMFHPEDGRGIYALPWQGVTLVGNTDLDEPDQTTEALAGTEPAVSRAEADYILEAVNFWSPGLGLEIEDALSGFCGLRPIVTAGLDRPEKEPRDHRILEEQGLITVAGGKLTLFGLMAAQAIKILTARLGRPDRPGLTDLETRDPAGGGLSPDQLRLKGRFGPHWPEVAQAAAASGREASIGTTEYLWAEIVAAAAGEKVVRLEDLMLRRTRLGLILPRGGAEYLDEIGEILWAKAGWSELYLRRQKAAYQEVWGRFYDPLQPGRNPVDRDQAA